jgi:hypothetical protein
VGWRTLQAWSHELLNFSDDETHRRGGSAVSITIHGDTRSPMGVASTTVAYGSRVSTRQRSSLHDAQSSL